MSGRTGASERPGRGLTIDRFSGVLLILLGLLVAWERRVLPLGTAHHPGPGYFPLLLAILLMASGVILVLRGKNGPLLRSVSWGEAFHAVPILACCVFTALFMEQMGYRLTIFLVLAFLFGIIERINLWLTMILAIGLSFGSFWIFDSMLRVPLPRGWWGF